MGLVKIETLYHAILANAARAGEILPELPPGGGLVFVKPPPRAAAVFLRPAARGGRHAISNQEAAHGFVATYCWPCICEFSSEPAAEAEMENSVCPAWKK